jgi:hypothetical protein
MPTVAGPPTLVPLKMETAVAVWVTVEAAATELLGVEVTVEIDPFSKVMVVVVVSSLLAV